MIIHYTCTLWNDDHTIKLISTSTTFFVWELLMPFFYSNFQVYNSVLLTIVTMLYIRSPRFTHLTTERYSLFIHGHSPSRPFSQPWSCSLVDSDGGPTESSFTKKSSVALIYEPTFLCEINKANQHQKMCRTFFFIIIDRSIYP